MLTGSYILQSPRHKIFNEGTDSLCMACNSDDETLEHMILQSLVQITETNPTGHSKTVSRRRKCYLEWSRQWRQNANPHGHYENLSVPKGKHKDDNRSGIPCKKTTL